MIDKCKYMYIKIFKKKYIIKIKVKCKIIVYDDQFYFMFINIVLNKYLIDNCSLFVENFDNECEI